MHACMHTYIQAALFGLKLYSQHHTLPYLEELVGARAKIPEDSPKIPGDSPAALSASGEPDGFFRFTFVRDPLDRFLSAFE